MLRISIYYRPQTKVIFSEACVKNSVHRGGVVSQHALQQVSGGLVVSQHALQQVSRGWYPSMPCRFPGPHPGGKFRGIWPGLGGGSPGPHPRGKLRGIWLGESPAPHPEGSAPGGGGVCSQGASAWSRGEVWRPPPRTATAADGTHPTGMHSCRLHGPGNLL